MMDSLFVIRSPLIAIHKNNEYFCVGCLSGMREVVLSECLQRMFDWIINHKIRHFSLVSCKDRFLPFLETES